MKNLEIKVHIHNTEEIKKELLSIDAKFIASLQQEDTYFLVGNNRFKLREEKEKKYLVFYRREDVTGSKLSKYYIVNISKRFLSTVKRLCSFIFGVKVIVKKKRELYIYENTRIHLDTVLGLGDFLELETVFYKEAGEKVLEEEHAFLCQTLNLASMEIIKESYSDLLVHSFR